MNPGSINRMYVLSDIPRGCGGEPTEGYGKRITDEYSPRMRGVNPMEGLAERQATDIPRGCGGEPGSISDDEFLKRYSPRMRG